MIYGYATKQINEDGLLEMKEVSFAASPETLRAVAAHLNMAAEQMSTEVNQYWHVHLDEEVARELGCDVIVVDHRRGPSARSVAEES